MGVDDNNRSAESIINEYSGCSEDELQQMLIRTIAEQKRDGNFDKETAENFKNMIIPLLNDEQQKKLMQVLSAIGAADE